MAKPHSSAMVSNAQLGRIRRMALEATASRWREDYEPCTYCGVIANSIDHVPPKCSREALLAAGLVLAHQYLEVPACRECNSVLGTIGIWTIGKRRAYIAKALVRRYKHVLGIPDWSDSELARMSPGMRGYILDGLMVRDFIQQRIAFSRNAR